MFDKVCLGMDNSSLPLVLETARAFRGCTRTVKIGAAFFATAGPMGVRRLVESGIRRIVLDLRICGSSDTLRSAIEAVADIGGIVALTIQLYNDPVAVHAAVVEAASTLERSGILLAVTLPTTICGFNRMSEWMRPTNTKWVNFLEQYAAAAVEAGIGGMLVDYHDFLVLQPKFPRLQYLVELPYRLTSPCQRPVEQPDLCRVIAQGPATVVLNPTAFGQPDMLWASDLLSQQLTRTRGRDALI